MAAFFTGAAVGHYTVPKLGKWEGDKKLSNLTHKILHDIDDMRLDAWDHMRLYIYNYITAQDVISGNFM